MKTFSRRDLLKTGLLAPAAVAAAQGMGPLGSAMEAAAQEPAAAAKSAANRSSVTAAGRERLLLDFGWRFHFGHADDPRRTSASAAAGRQLPEDRQLSCPPATIAFDDSDWRAVDLPHDWAIELPFKNDPGAGEQRLLPAGPRSIRRPASAGTAASSSCRPPMRASASRSSSTAAYRETMVVFNGFYIGRHSGGYDPFSFDVTDFANPGGRNVLLVRVDAT